MLTLKCSRSVWDKILVRYLVIGTLAATGVLAGVVPTISNQSPGLTFQNTAQAVDLSSKELLDYAKVLLAIEPLRQSTYDDIKRIVGSRSSRIPNIVCSQPSSFRELPGNARQIAINYCNSSREIVRSHELTIERFNQITTSVQSDPGLKRRVQNAMIQLQR
ncbi:DUF4168 domain-containing protein [Lusitaniella coriacea LEGE 07157]|uniref:DUF4168 domain-containing protein n=1 Tax=Lusitaniella coriacea LEGE 07157 TaxID=945747 RepID=A0A8J7AVZ8_9CYAN|nr:DUF4168 domain-containing protein [Lusitaniella coriacea]MBE9114312.1 DUF4168 domain-containing protein [Lusitaniella coriacea LEGE 07157]